jgi:hypothetical protein
MNEKPRKMMLDPMPRDVDEELCRKTCLMFKSTIRIDNGFVYINDFKFKNWYDARIFMDGFAFGIDGALRCTQRNRDSLEKTALRALLKANYKHYVPLEGADNGKRH